jgi:hypothetical protein
LYARVVLPSSLPPSLDGKMCRARLPVDRGLRFIAPLIPIQTFPLSSRHRRRAPAKPHEFQRERGGLRGRANKREINPRPVSLPALFSSEQAVTHCQLHKSINIISTSRAKRSHSFILYYGEIPRPVCITNPNPNAKMPNAIDVNGKTKTYWSGRGRGNLPTRTEIPKF